MSFDSTSKVAGPNLIRTFGSSMANNVEIETVDKKEMVFNAADKDGHYRRKASQFRDWVSANPEAKFPAERGRYVLYLNLGCPW